MSELTTRGTRPPLSPISESSIEQRGCMKVHWTERGVDRVHSVVSCHECFEFEDEWDIGCVQPIRVDSHSRCCNLQEFHCCMVKREVERIGCRQTGKSWWRANRLWTSWLEFSLHRAQQCKRMELRHQQTWQNQLQTPQRSIRQRKSPCPLNRDIYCEQPNQINVYLKVKTQRQRVALEFTHTHGGMCMERPLMTCIGDDRIQIWRTHHLIEPILPLSPEWTKFW